jgi:hypothetical protein
LVYVARCAETASVLLLLLLLIIITAIVVLLLLRIVLLIIIVVVVVVAAASAYSASASPDPAGSAFILQLEITKPALLRRHRSSPLFVCLSVRAPVLRRSPCPSSSSSARPPIAASPERAPKCFVSVSFSHSPSFVHEPQLFSFSTRPFRV